MCFTMLFLLYFITMYLIAISKYKHLGAYIQGQAGLVFSNDSEAFVRLRQITIVAFKLSSFDETEISGLAIEGVPGEKP